MRSSGASSHSAQRFVMAVTIKSNLAGCHFYHQMRQTFAAGFTIG